MDKATLDTLARTTKSFEVLYSFFSHRTLFW